MTETIHVALLYPCDPIEPIIGGIESFIRGIIVNAPANIKYSVIGATTNPKRRALGRWTECKLGEKSFRYFPLYAVNNRGARPKIPATVRYEMAAMLRMPNLAFADIIESHRIEHLLLRGKNKPFNLFLHQNMMDLNNPQSDIRWKTLPGLYRKMEKQLFKRRGHVFCVREDAVANYQTLYPKKKAMFHFQPTWMDENIFFPVNGAQATAYRAELCQEFALIPNCPLAIAVGRLDKQKDPMLMVEAIAKVTALGKGMQLLWIGDGILRAPLQALINQLRLNQIIKLAGLQNPEYIANALRGGDFFILSSAYEGMPIALLEALACGKPAVATSVGEIPRLIHEGVNGFLASSGDPETLSQAIIAMLEKYPVCAGVPCLAVADNWRAGRVLAQVYQSYQQTH